MVDLKKDIELFYGAKRLHIRPHTAAGATLYIISFPDGTPRLVITMANGVGRKFWTSIPEGRLQEAEKIGPLITAYYQQLAST